MNFKKECIIHVYGFDVLYILFMVALMADETTSAYLKFFRTNLDKSGISLRLANYLLELQLTDSANRDRKFYRTSLAEKFKCSVSSITNAITKLEVVGIIEPLGECKKDHGKELRLIPPNVSLNKEPPPTLEEDAPAPAKVRKSDKYKMPPRRVKTSTKQTS